MLRHAGIFIRPLQSLVQRADAVDLWLIRDTGEVETEADVDVLLRQVIAVDQHLADLVGGIGVFALLGIVVLKQEFAVGLFDNRPGVGLDFVCHAQDLADLGSERGLGAEKDVALGCAVSLRSSTTLA